MSRVSSLTSNKNHMSQAIKANDPNRRSWVDVPANSDFPIQNIPFGIFSTDGTAPRTATIIGDTVIDLSALARLGYLSDTGAAADVFSTSTLNAFLELGKATWRAVRDRISDIFEADNGELRDNSDHKAQVLSPAHAAQMYLPVQVGDYTDFYASKEHATNVGTMFRDPANALLPNWLHLPVGYHGRASSIVVSGTPLHRPMGQTRPDPEQPPVFGPCRLFDFELEMGYVLGQGKPLGHRIGVNEASDYIFGVTLFNDWSARDIQKWEYVPLGPFLGKNFGSSMSPWIVTLDALEPFRIPAQERLKPILPYLQQEKDGNIDVNLSVLIQPEGGEEEVISRSNFKYMYWSAEQMLAHHTVNGCNVKAGDMFASGTISGPTPDSYGSMLELCWRGTKPITLKDGSERKFLKDGDTLILRGHAEKDGIRIGFGEVNGQVLPAIQ